MAKSGRNSYRGRGPSRGARRYLKRKSAVAAVTGTVKRNWKLFGVVLLAGVFFAGMIKLVIAKIPVVGDMFVKKSM